MKQSEFSKIIFDVFIGLDHKTSYVLDGFHPGLFLSLYKYLEGPIVLVVPDNNYDLSCKYLSSLGGDEAAVFVPPALVGDSPDGFLHPYILDLRRSKEILSSGLGNVSFVLCAYSALNSPLIGSGNSSGLKLDTSVGFDECLAFLMGEDYVAVDLVCSHGEFSVRGGIIDVFPFSSTTPIRINFLDDGVLLWRFDVENQLTSNSLALFHVPSVKDDPLCSLNGINPSGFLFLFYDPNKEMLGRYGDSVGFSSDLQYVSFDFFRKNTDISGPNIFIDNCLTSVAVVNSLNHFYVPRWFVHARAHMNDISENAPPPLSLGTSDLGRGDFLTHRDHGIGMFMGLITKRSSGGGVQEALSIKYADGGLIRLDVRRLDIIDFYAPAGSLNVELDSLQRKGSWARRLSAAKRRAEETIDHILNLYVQRSDVCRAGFVSGGKMENDFLVSFPYQDTQDQSSAWASIAQDLSSSSPMDRLVCGDVGFGKTELAIRAAFRVVLGGMRVVVIAPTTILANQLFTAFYSRLNPFAVNVEMVSRFRSKKEVVGVQKKIMSGDNDVLVGTHTIFNDDIFLNNMGLLIIDEEHRFGVKHKERVRGHGSGVDVLSLSATPIPRSLNLALSGIYSISLLQTPPRTRLPIITRVCAFDESLIRDVVVYETTRGGQVYFVHNNTQDIGRMADRLREFFSHLSVEFIHGQEHSKQIEKKMGLFVSGKIHVLVCTSIIEAGIDVPNANSIIINNAHLFGLAQLYQIRGRVGRGDRQAHAYLMLPNNIDLSKQAFNRIKTIEENVRLGSGYNIAQSDMEIRGGGSLFGYKQSGGGNSVGYEMYLRLIRRALHGAGHLKTGFVLLPEDISIDIFNNKHIPEEYISVESIRLTFYKSLCAATNDKELDGVVYSLVDRFGEPPVSVENLICECRLRLLSSAVGIKEIYGSGCGVVCSFVFMDSVALTESYLNYIEMFFGRRNISFHFLPKKGGCLSFCVHFSGTTDKYSILSKFLNKFEALK